MTAATTTAPSSATVETLTAEVRTLVVGSRQVTLSVYRQLDECGYTAMVPFGRVRDSRERGLWLVGRAPDGSLARAKVPHPDWSPWEGPKEWWHWLHHTPPPDRPRSGNVVVASEGNRRIVWKAEYTPYGTCPAEPMYSARVGGPGPSEDCPGRDVLEQTWRDSAAEELQFMLDEQREYDRMDALPLIVLAGLR